MIAAWFDVERLDGGLNGGATRIGQSVRRPTGDGLLAVHHLLNHLELAGFTGAPRVLGIEADGHELLTFVDGEAGSLMYPHALLEEGGVVEWGRFIRGDDDAVGIRLSPRTTPYGALGGRGCVRGRSSVTGTSDIGTPCGVTVTLSAPSTGTSRSRTRHFATWLLQLLEPSHFSDDERARRHFPEPPERRRRLAALCDGYEAAAPNEVLDAAVQYLQAEALRVTALGSEGREPGVGITPPLRCGRHSETTSAVRSSQPHQARLAARSDIGGHSRTLAQARMSIIGPRPAAVCCRCVAPRRCSCAVLAATVPAGAQASSRGESPGFRWVIVKHGQTSGTAWMLSAIDSGDGRYCVKVSVEGAPRAKNCGRFFERGPSGSPVLLGSAADSDGPQPTFVVGAVTQLRGGRDHSSFRWHFTHHSCRRFHLELTRLRRDRLLHRNKAMHRLSDRHHRS